ncbi:MAG: carbohydrate-binding family 9-like protein, partial [Leeuwenhoekiella sp.]
WDFDLKNGDYSRKIDSKTGKFLPEHNWVWSPQEVINMHEPERWGYLFFSTEKPGKKADFSIPKDEYIKWYLYEIYRKCRTLPENERNNKAIGIVSAEKTFFGKTIKPAFKNQGDRWTISTKSPFSNKIMQIQEDGKFTSHEK